MANACTQCNRTGSCDSACPSLFWVDTKTRRGDNPGRPPAKSMTLSEEMGKIFSTVKTVNTDTDA